MAAITGAIIGAATSVVGAHGQRSAARRAQGEAQRAAELQRSHFLEGRSLVDQYTSPYREAGRNAIGAMQGMMGLGNQPYDLTTDPGYNFRLSQGIGAMDASASSKGNLLSGGALKDMNQFGQDMASQEYMAIYQRLAQMAGIGISATNTMSNAAMGTGTGMAGVEGNLGNTMASGEVAIGNANAGMWSDIGSAITMGIGGGEQSRGSAYTPSAGQVFGDNTRSGSHDPFSGMFPGMIKPLTTGGN